MKIPVFRSYVVICCYDIGIHGDHLRSGTSLIAITRLTGHLETVINWTVMYATWRGGWELSQHQQPVVHCGGDPGVPECTVLQGRQTHV